MAPALYRQALYRQEPTELLFLKPDGEPATGVEFRVYQLPNTTQWVGNGISDGDGRARTACVNDSECVLIADDETRFQVMMDVPIDLHPQSAPPVITIGAGPDTFVEATCAGKPVFDALFTLHGKETGVLFTGFYTGEDGRTSNYKLHPRSQAIIQLENSDLWAPVRRVPFEVGRNAFEVWRTGKIQVGTLQDLELVESREFKASIADWIHLGAVESEVADAAVLCTVPTGIYDITRSDGSKSSFTVEIGVTAFIRP